MMHRLRCLDSCNFMLPHEREKEKMKPHTASSSLVSTWMHMIMMMMLACMLATTNHTTSMMQNTSDIYCLLACTATQIVFATTILARIILPMMHNTHTITTLIAKCTIVPPIILAALTTTIT